MSEIEQRIIDIIAKMIDTDSTLLEPSSTLVDFEIPSINQLEIMFAIEEEYDVYLPDEADALTLRGLAEIVQKLVDKKKETDSS